MMKSITKSTKQIKMKDDDDQIRRRRSQSQSLNLVSSSIDETSKKVVSSLVPSIQKHFNTTDFDPKTDGLDFLHAKNSLLLSYLIDLTKLLSYQHNHTRPTMSNSSMRMSQEQLTQCLKRLNEMKVILEKIKPLEKKMRYQIDKLLTISSTSSSFAAVTSSSIGNDSENSSIDDNDIQKKKKEDDENLVEMDESDPLAFRPNLDGFGTDNEDNDEDDNDKNDGYSDSDNEEADDDDEIRAAKEALKIGQSKNCNSDQINNTTKTHNNNNNLTNNNNNNTLYKAPRLTSTPYTEKEDPNKKQQKLLSKQRQKLQKSELLSTLKESFTETPEEDDMYGGSNIGKSREAAKRFAQKEEEKLKFEEDKFVRLTMSRQEKKMKNKIMRDEISTLNSIADIGNITSGISMAFGEKGFLKNNNSDDDYGSDDGHQFIRVSGGRGSSISNNNNKSDRYANGKRRRQNDIGSSSDNNNQKRGKSSKKGQYQPQNSFQKALYGMDGGNGASTNNKGKKKNKKKQR